MLSREVAINEYQLGMFDKIVMDIADDSLFLPAAGHGHPPVWILGHLAICAELGQRHLGGVLQHPEWVPLFCTGSSDAVEPGAALDVSNLSRAVTDGYRELQSLASSQSDEFLLREHGVASLSGTPIQTVADAIATLLTNHFGFHLSQLSSCRRSAGHQPLH
jgi:hypothetical protein